MCVSRCIHLWYVFLIYKINIFFVYIFPIYREMEVPSFGHDVWEQRGLLVVPVCVYLDVSIYGMSF